MAQANKVTGPCCCQGVDIALAARIYKGILSSLPFYQLICAAKRLNLTMTTKFAALNSYPRFGISPHMSTFSMAPRQNRHLSLPRIEVLVESDDSDDEGSYHSMHLKAYERCVEIFLKLHV